MTRYIAYISKENYFNRKNNIENQMKTFLNKGDKVLYFMVESPTHEGLIQLPVDEPSPEVN
jgi:exosome complex RNA-binding protein Rrp4